MDMLDSVSLPENTMIVAMQDSLVRVLENNSYSWTPLLMPQWVVNCTFLKLLGNVRHNDGIV